LSLLKKTSARRKGPKIAKEAYVAAGVDIDTADRAKQQIARMARSTFTPGVLSGPGFFGGLFEFKGYKQPVLVSSCDGVGTKLKIATALDKHDTVGIDIVNHSINDIFTSGASPLFFLDYIATGKLVPDRIESIVKGLTVACKEGGCALIGGETATMPGLYAGEDYDLAGFIVGVVEKPDIIMGKNITPGDAIIGLPSTGLHTNGYSLARKIFGDTRKDMEKTYPEIGRTIGEALLEPHRSYYQPLKHLLSNIKGLAHITGGGLVGNVPRILPDTVTARFHQSAWTVPALFKLMQEKGKVDRAEMYKVFNMGIGMVVVCAADKAATVTKSVSGALLIGEITKRSSDPVIVD
jgi:phosphoribosylformylglycinamidine cyclo-ligase